MDYLNHINIATFFHRISIILHDTNRIEYFIYKHDILLYKAFHKLNHHVKFFKEQESVNVLWALGKMGPKILETGKNKKLVKEVFQALCYRILELENLESYHIANIVMSLGRLRHKDYQIENLLFKMCKKAIDQIEIFQLVSLGNVIWGLGNLKFTSCPILIQEIERKSLEKSDDFRPQPLINLLLGMAYLQHRPLLNFFLVVEEYFFGNIEELKQREISGIVWSFAKITYLPSDAFFLKLDHFIKCHKFEPRNVCNLLYAFAYFGKSTSDDVLEMFKNDFKNEYGMFLVHGASTFLWSLAMLGKLDLDIFNFALTNFFNNRKVDTLDCVQQLGLCVLHLKTFCGVDESEMKMAPFLMNRVKENMKFIRKKLNQNETVVLEVLDKLKEIGYNECDTDQYDLGTLVYPKVRKFEDSQKIAVYAFFPDHYFLNRALLDGTKMWVLKVLEKQGYKVLKVEVKKWNDLLEENKILYLDKLLRVL